MEDSSLDFGDIGRLLRVTEERARAAQEAAESLRLILQKVDGLDSAVDQLVSCTVSMQGALNVIIAYLGSRDEQERERIRRIMEDADLKPQSLSITQSNLQMGNRGEIKSGRDVEVG